jgi:hypothetical protein
MHAIPSVAELVPTLESPARSGAAVTPSDTTDLTVPARALWIGVGGDVRVRFLDGAVVELRGVASGTLLPISVLRVYATGHTGTAASAIVALR